MRNSAQGLMAAAVVSPIRRSRSSRKAANDRSVEAIHDRIYAAIFEHRLHPGTKLGEDRMAAIFGVSRARVREVFARLAHEGVIELFPQRGAFVAKPTIEQARHVFEMRRLIEPGILRRLIANTAPEKLARLREHLGREVDARRRDDARAVIRLSGEFHTLLAELAGNTVLAKSMFELTTQTCLVIFLYDTPTSDACRADEHSKIVDAITRGDAPRAEALMLEHLDHIEASLKLGAVNEDVDLEAIFS